MKFVEFEKLVEEVFLEDTLKSFSPCIAYRREYEGHHYPGYEVGVTIRSSRFLFLWEEGGGVMIGRLTSNFENTQSGWFSLDRIVCFVTHQPFVWESPYQSLPRDEQIASTLRAVQAAFAPYVDQIVMMFSSEKKVSEWISDYEHYEDQQFMLKYPSYFEKYKKRKKAMT